MAKLDRQEQDGVMVLHLSGILDQTGVRTIERQFQEVVKNSKKTVADLAGVSSLSTSGITLLLGALCIAEQNAATFVLTGTRGHTQDVLKRCRLDSVFTIEPDISAGVIRATA